MRFASLAAGSLAVAFLLAPAPEAAAGAARASRPAAPASGSGAAVPTGVAPAAASGTAPASIPLARYVPGRFAVRFKPGAVPRAGAEALRAMGVGASGWTLLVPASIRGAGDGGPGDRLARTIRILLNPGADPESAAAAWRGRPDVEEAVPIRLIPLLEAAPTGGPGGDAAAGGAAGAPGGAAAAGAQPAFIPADPLLSSQWQHDAIGSYAAWDLSAGDSSVVIAIVDTGTDYTHPDLQPNLWINRAEADGSAGVDDDGNGYVDDVHGYDFTDVPEVNGAGDYRERDPDPMDEVGHGTWVTGVACAAGNNAVGGAGVAWGARFMTLRAGYQPRTGFTLGYLAEDDAAAAIAYAVDNGADVLNLSFGDVVRAPLLEDAVSHAVERGLVVVAAAGNSGTGEPFYPACLPGVLAVGAEDRNGHRSSYSTWGPSVALLAPGDNLLTTGLEGGHVSMSGTSLASPVAAGAAAILRSLHPDWPAGRIVAALIESARTPAASADAHGARLLRLDEAVGRDPGAVIALEEIGEGDSFDRDVWIRGSVQGPLVRGWRLLARGPGGGAWRSLAAEPRRAAVDEILSRWDVSGEPEGAASLRIEALGIDGIVASRDVTIRIDHTPPELRSLEVLPVVSGDGWGLRAVAEVDEPAFGRMAAPAGASAPFEFGSVVAGTRVVLGIDGPLPSGAASIPVELELVNGAGLSTREVVLVDLPGVPDAGSTTRTALPGAWACMPRLLDLNGDGCSDLVGESVPLSGAAYGDVWVLPICESDPDPDSGVHLLGERYMPRDAADFDGNGRPDILGLAVQAIRVYSPSEAGGYPDTLVWSSTEAWASRFIPAPSGPGCDIVASRDSAIRIYRRDGGQLALRQVIENPTTGVNTISPEIALLRADPDQRFSLATLDGDNDLIVVTRDGDGAFAPRWSARLEGEFLPLVVAADLDGDGLDEITLVECEGGIPSPAAGLRDGFYRLRIFRAQEDGSFAPWLAGPGAAGYFPGVPVSLDGFDLDGSGRADLWWGVNGTLYRLRLEGGTLGLVESWNSVGTGRPAAGNLETLSDPGASVPALIYPGDYRWWDGASGPMFRAAGSPALPRVVDLRVEETAVRGDLVDVRLSWSGGSPPYELRRSLATGQLEPVTTTAGIMTNSWWDSSLVAGASYAYTMRIPGDRLRWVEPLVITARPRDTVTGVVASPGVVEIAWEHPVLATGRAQVLLLAPAEAGSAGSSGTAGLFGAVEGGGSAPPETLAVSSALLDQGGNRLRITPAAPLEAGRHYAWEVTGYLSDARLPLTGADAAGEFTLPQATPRLALRSVRLADARGLLLEFDPGVPINPDPTLIQVEPGIRLISAVARDATTLLAGIDAATPLSGGRAYTVRLLPGLTGPGGELLEQGAGDVLAFRADPVVYPNPIRPTHREVRFDWLSEGSRVRVFSLDGREIWAGECGGAGWLSWDLRDGDGRRVAPGVYLYLIDGAVGLTGKLAVVR